MATNERPDAVERVRQELHRAVESVRMELDRIELLTGALDAFSRPVPDYEPRLRHLHQPPLNAFRLRASTGRKH